MHTIKKVFASVLVVLGILPIVAMAQSTSYASAVKAVQPALVAIQAENQTGSGMVVSENGLVLTNRHVVQQAPTVQVALADGRSFTGRVVAEAPYLDIALVQLEAASNLTPVRFGASGTLSAGDVVLSVGYPFGGAQSVSVGVVGSPKRRNVMANPYQPFIQTDAALAPGSSGGALITPNGLVVGMVAAVEQGGTKSMGFALPSDTLMAVLNDWRQYGRVQLGWFGAEGRALRPAEAQALGTPVGVVLTLVLPRTPAENAGLKVGDVVLKVEGQAVQNPQRLPRHLAELRTALDAPIALEVLRNGQVQRIGLTLGNTPPRRSAEAQIIKGYNPLNSMQLEPLTPPLAQELDLPLATQGVVITRLSDTPLGGFAGHFEIGDVVIKINGQNTFTPRAAQGALNTSRRAWEFEFFRAGELRKLQL